jgi:hypothetical protein
VGDLARFFAQAAKRENLRVAVSARFVDEAGEPILWELKPLSAADMQSYLADCAAKREFAGGRLKQEEIMLGLLAKSVVYPDLQDAELQDSYGVMGAENLLLAMLSPGEYRALQKAFEGLNMQGLPAERVAQAKN